MVRIRKIDPLAEYRWEESPSLRHGCAVCKISLNHPRAKLSCYGKHSEPCIRFHHTMFRMGHAHKCDPCRKSVEQHDKRHREIGNLIKQIERIDHVETDTVLDNSRTLPLSLSNLGAHGKDIDGDWVSIEDESLLSVEDFDDGLSPMSPSPLLRKSKEVRIKKRAAKHAREVAKALRHQKQLGSPAVTEQMVGDIQLAIHQYSATTDRDSFNRNLFHDIERECQIQQPVSSPKTVLGVAYIRTVINTFGIQLTNAAESKDRKVLLERLANAIKLDIEVIANESRETMKRQTGYYRYADKSRYNAMVRNKQLFDWRTGTTLLELELNVQDELQDQPQDGINPPDRLDVDPDEFEDMVVTNEDSSSTGADVEMKHKEQVSSSESDLLLRRSDGALTFAIKPRPKPKSMVKSPAKKKVLMPKEVRKPRSRDSSPQRVPRRSPRRSPVRAGPAVRPDPIITHVKRQPGSKNSVTKPLHKKEKQSSNDGLDPEAHVLALEEHVAISEEPVKIQMQMDMDKEDVQPVEPSIPSQDYKSAEEYSDALEIVSEDGSHSEAVVGHPSTSSTDEEESEKWELMFTCEISRDIIHNMLRRQLARIVTRPRARKSWDVLYKKWADRHTCEVRWHCHED